MKSQIIGKFFNYIRKNIFQNKIKKVSFTLIQTLGNKVAITVLFSLSILKHIMLISTFPNCSRLLFLPHRKIIVYRAISNSGLTPTYIDLLLLSLLFEKQKVF